MNLHLASLGTLQGFCIECEACLCWISHDDKVSIQDPVNGELFARDGALAPNPAWSSGGKLALEDESKSVSMSNENSVVDGLPVTVTCTV